MSLRIRRGSDAERLAVRFDQGEIVWVNSTTTSRPAYKLYVGDGVTYGGKDIVETSAGNKLTYNTNTGRLDVSGLTTDDIAPGTNNKFFTPELAQDAVGAMFAAGTMSGITFVYDDVGNKMNVTVTATGGGGGGGGGIAALLNDPSPHLGGSLTLNNQNIVGTGNIDITGNVTATGNLTATGTITATTGLGADLHLNGFNLSGTGNVNITGNMSASGQLSVSGGLGHDLALNGYNITGDGGLIINGSILTATGLGGNLPLNSHNITGNGNIILDSGSLTLSSGNATLTSGNLTISSGNITANGSISDTVLSINSGIITSANNQVTFGSNSSRNNVIINQGINSTGFTIHAQSDGAQGLSQYAARLRLTTVSGTLASPTVLTAGDICGQMNFGGYVNGGSDTTSGLYDLAVIRSVVTDQGDLISRAGSGKLQLFVVNNNDPLNSKYAELDVSGVFSAPVIKTGVYTTTPTDLRPSSPTKGMIVFNDTAGKFQGYNGTAWVNLG